MCYVTSKVPKGGKPNHKRVRPKKHLHKATKDQV